MTAADDAEPGRMATADVTILVQRNANAPKFGRRDYRATVSDRATLGEPIVNITAIDEDGVSPWHIFTIRLSKEPAEIAALRYCILCMEGCTVV